MSKTNPTLWDTDGDGKSDGMEVLLGTDPLRYNEPSPLEMPAAGSTSVRILAPDLLELVRISADTNTWNFVTNGLVNVPGTDKFQVNTSGGTVPVMEVGYKRRPLYAPVDHYDLRIENTLYLRLGGTNWATGNARVEVTSTDGSLWPATMRFVCLNDPLRYSPAIHVSQVGYSPNSQKKAMVGYYLGNLGEMQLSTNPGFQLVDAATGSNVYSGTLSARPDVAESWGNSSLAQYQNVLEADFTTFSSTGEYRLVVPGLGASYPFRIDDGCMMKLARTYALGLYHQRCGSGPQSLQVNDPHFTRFSHPNCHTNRASVPLPVANYQSTWFIMSNNYATVTYTKNTDNPPQLAPPVTNYSAFLFPYTVSNLPIDVSLGHHDAGDYSKYTINSALLIHTLTFAADNLGLAAFDNFGLPESGDGIPDLLQELKWEADFLVKMQDTNDGGFYFLVYPRDREYDRDGNALPQYGDPQIVWPKTTAATAAAVGALAEIGSSKIFGSYFAPSVTNAYMQAASNGWKFLTNAIALYHKDGCYQRITHYGDDFTHDDELAWAAASLFAATGDTNYQAKLFKWFPNPADTNGHNGFRFKRYDSTNNFPSTSNLFVAVAYIPNTNSVTNVNNTIWFKIWDSEGAVVVNETQSSIPHVTDIAAVSNKLYNLKTSLNASPNDLFVPSALDMVSGLVGNCHATRWSGWWRCFAGYGCAVRDYAFAARSGRRSPGSLNSAYLQQCESEITNRALDVRIWSTNNAYGTSLDPYTKNAYSPISYFAGDRTFDLAVADRIQADPGNTNAIVENLNYEAGRNPINVSRITGLGSYQQREIVDQFSQNNKVAVLPHSGIPLGNMCQTLGYTPMYGNMDQICVPAIDRGSNYFALYDRWAEVHNVNTEFVHPYLGRDLASAAYLVTSSALRTQAWKSGAATIVFSNSVPSLNGQRVAFLSSTQDLSQAQIVWDPSRVAWNFYGHQPAIGPKYTFIATNIGDPPLQAEAVLPDGRRFFAVTNLQIWSTNGGAAFPDNDTNTIALYHFDDPVNLWADSSGHNYDLKPHGLVDRAVNPNWMATPTGYVATFRDIIDYLEITTIPNTNILGSTNSSLTIEARIYPRAYLSDGGSSEEILTLYQNYYSGTQAAQWSVYYWPGAAAEAPEIYANPKVVLDHNAWNQAMTPNTWHSLKITFAPSGVTTACIDGSAVCRSTNSPPYYGWTTDWRLTMGHFDGDIDEVRISNTVRP